MPGRLGKSAGCATRLEAARSSKKIAEPREFNDLFGGQNCADRFSLWIGVDLVQMTYRCGLRHELPYALVQSAIRNEVATRVADAFVFDRGPLPERGASIKVHLSIRCLHCSDSAWLF